MTKQLEGKDMEDLEGADIQPIDMSMQVLKEVGAGWIVTMSEYLSLNPVYCKWICKIRNVSSYGWSDRGLGCRDK